MAIINNVYSDPSHQMCMNHKSMHMDASYVEMVT